MKKRLFLFWQIGQNVYNKQKLYENVFKKYSIFYSYQFGMPHVFSIDNIKYMLRFYCLFPIYYSALDKLSWEHYCLILNNFDRDVQYFYFRIALFCKSSVEELKILINNNFYDQIKKEI